MKFLRKLKRPPQFVEAALKQPLASFNFLETGEGKNTIAKDGSIMTLIRIDGIQQAMGPAELDALIDKLTISLSASLGKPGHAIQVWFARDPDLSADLVKGLTRPPRQVSEKLALEMDDVFAERERHLPKFIVWEGFFIAAWTRLPVLTPQELKSANLDTKKPTVWPRMADAQDIFKTIGSLLQRHESFVQTLMDAFSACSIRAEALNVHDAYKHMKWSIYPDLIGADWEPSLPGSRGKVTGSQEDLPGTPIPFRSPELGANDGSHAFWPRLDDQLIDREAEYINPRICRIGSRYFAGVDMTVGPQELLPFSQMINRMSKSDEFPWRVSFLLEGQKPGIMWFKGLLCAIFGMTSGQNRQIREAIKELHELQNKDVAIVRLRTSFATWAPAGGKPIDLELIEKRSGRLQRSVESWGYCNVAPTAGDPVAGVMSSALGFDTASTAPAGAPPLSYGLMMLPWNRDASPWKFGSVLFRTEDGRVWPFLPGSSLQDVYIDLIYAPPGKGKSVYLNTTSLALCLSAQATIGLGGLQLPRIAIIDIGPSSSGLISLIKEALPAERRHEAAYYRLQMSKKYAINPFDTQLGCRKPLRFERASLINFITLLGTPVGMSAPPTGLAELAGMVIDEIYNKFDDRSRKSTPRRYTAGEDYFVDKAIDTYNLRIKPDDTWWSVVDALFKAGAIHEAGLAQRHAVPRVEDISTALTMDQVVDIHGSAKTQHGESVIEVLRRMVSSALRDFEILTMPTKFDIGLARVVSLDLDQVAPKGGPSADKQTAMMYMLARFVTIKDFYLNEEDIPSVNAEYATYHTARIKRIRETPKRAVYDEFHRTESSPVVRHQIVQDMREGRKWGVHIALASQLLGDFTKEMIELASGYWVMGVSNELAVQEAQKTFGLTNTATDIVKRHLNGPTSKGAPFLAILSLKDGRHEHLLYNTLGPIEIWAFSTTPLDSALRNRLYETLGAKNSRQLLATRFPSGSAVPEIERRIMIAAERGLSNDDAKNGVIEELARELERMA